MLELLHAVITSLLLSAAAGCGMEPAACTDEEPANSETGIDVGKLPSHLLAPRGLSSSEQDQDDHQPTALAEPAAFCEPAIRMDRTITPSASLPPAVSFATAGRSP